MRDRVVIFHGPGCADGFTGAWICNTVYGDSATYVEAHYGEPPPDVTGKRVTIVDFSYPRAVLLEMATKAASILVLDHHASAQRDLEGLDFCKFDMNESGATLAWKTLRPGERLPTLAAHVLDRDLWKWELPDSKEISAFISVQDRTFDRWGALNKQLDDHNGFLEAAFAGAAILKHIDAYVESTAKTARIMRVSSDRWEFDTIPVVNAPGMMASELVGFLAERVYFAVGWHQMQDGRFKYSLRSRGDVGADVSRIAEAFGGSGHRNASGFVSTKPPWELFEAKEST